VSEMSLPIFYQTRQLGSDGWRLSFEAHRRGRGRRVFVYPREDGVWFLVRRGEGVLACVDVPGREWVRLREVNFFLGGRPTRSRSSAPTPAPAAVASRSARLVPETGLHQAGPIRADAACRGAG